MISSPSRRWLLCGAVLFCSAQAIAQPSTQPISDVCTRDPECLGMVRSARSLSDAGQFHSALRGYRAAYERWPAIRLLVQIGRMHQKLGDLQEAIRNYDSFLSSPDAQLYPEFTETAQRYKQDAIRDLPPPPGPHPGTVTGGRPRWRLVTGGVAIGSGLLLTGFAASALAANGSCVDIPSAPAQTCDRVYTTGPVGGALLGTGAAVVAGGIILMAWPGK